MSESKNQIAFEQSGLGSVLKQNQLVVPPNQREYSWTDRQVTQLFQDFAKAIADGEAGYFLGTIVTIPRTNGNLEVVDGQQRLATTAILLAAIRDYLQGKEDVLVESINNEFLTGIDRIKRARVPRLRLNVDDNELFGWLLARAGAEPNCTRSSHDRLKGAYEEGRKHVRAIVSSLDPKDHGDLLNAWVSFIEHRALVVLLRVPNDANAYKMYSQGIAVPRNPNANESRKVQPVLSAQFHRYLNQLVALGYGKTPTEAARYLIERGIDDLIRTKTIGPGFRHPRKR